MNSPFNGTFRVTQEYKGDTHKGIDIVGMDDKTVHSTVNGIVEAARWDTKAGSTAIDPKYGMGQYIRIRDDATGQMYYFAHLSKFLVSASDRVKKGEEIGIEGSTGHATGSHLHYEIRKTTDNKTFLNVSQISGIPNALGTYSNDPDNSQSAYAESFKLVQSKAGLSDITMKYLASYQYSEDLIIKLASAMKPV